MAFDASLEMTGAGHLPGKIWPHIPSSAPIRKSAAAGALATGAAVEEIPALPRSFRNRESKNLTIGS